MPTSLVFGVEVEILLNLLRKPQEGYSDTKDLDAFGAVLLPYFNEKMKGKYHMSSDVDGVTDHIACQSWIHLVISFVKAACHRLTSRRIENYTIDVAGLQAFVWEGLDGQWPDGISARFHYKNGSIVPTPIGSLSALKRQELSEKAAQDDSKNVMRKKMNQFSKP